jgi:hypothetical protein
MKISSLRWFVITLITLIFFATVINYIDRQTMSVLKGAISRDLGLSNADYAAIRNSIVVLYGISQMGGQCVRPGRHRGHCGDVPLHVGHGPRRGHAGLHAGVRGSGRSRPAGPAGHARVRRQDRADSEGGARGVYTAPPTREVRVRDRMGIDPRVLLSSGLAALAAPPSAVGMAALGVPLPIAGTGIALAAAAVVAMGWRRLPGAFAAPVQGRSWLLVAWLALVLVAGFHTARLSTFMHDAARADLSVLPDRPFFCSHTCLSAYTEASRLAPSAQNVYDPKAYMDRKLGRLDVDLFQYPPAFLLLGGMLRAGSEDFLVNRAVWFLVQSLGFFAAALALAVWVGGVTGARIAWLIPVVWVATPTLITLQLGNFQISALAWSVGAMVLASSGWVVAAGALLGFCAAGKIFPGVLGLYLLMRRQWAPVLWTAAWALAWLLLAIAWFGMKPQWDFLLYQVPRIQSGEAFFWVDSPAIAGVNHSIYGLVARLRAGGVPGMTREFGNILASAYGAGVLALAACLGWRRRGVPIGQDGSRLSEVTVWFALLNLGSLRSPFVPDAYAFLGSLWLGALIVAGPRRLPPAGVALAGLAWFAFTRVFDGLLAENTPTPPWMLAVTLLTQVTALAFNLWVVWRALSVRLPVPHAGDPLAQWAAQDSR